MKNEIHKALQVRASSKFFIDGKLEAIDKMKDVSWKVKAFNTGYNIDMAMHHRELERAKMMLLISELFIKKAVLNPNLMWKVSGKMARWDQFLVASVMIYDLKLK